MRWLVLLVFTGCVFAQTRHDVEVPLSVHVMPTFVGPPLGIVLTVTESYGTLHVDAARARFCYREVKQLVEHREEVDSGGGWGGGLAGAIVGASVSALADAAANAGEDSAIEDRTLSVRKTDCSIPAAGARIAVEMPSGEVVRAVTDARGLVHIEIPATEPETGTAIVRAEDATVRIAYSLAH